MFTGFNHVTIVVQDKNAAEAFDIAKLGLEKVIIGDSLWARVGNQYIHINENSTFKNQKTFAHFAIEIDNLQRYLKQLVEKDVQVFDFDENMNETDASQNFDTNFRCFFIRDPFGNLIELIDATNSFFSPRKS